MSGGSGAGATVPSREGRECTTILSFAASASCSLRPGSSASASLAWRAWSRKIITLARTIPLDHDAYPDWHAANGKALRAGLAEAAQEFLAFADFEEQFFTDLRAAAGRLR